MWFPVMCIFCFNFRARFGGKSNKKHANYFIQFNLRQQIETVLKRKYLSQVFQKILLKVFNSLDFMKIKQQLFCDTKEIIQHVLYMYMYIYIYIYIYIIYIYIQYIYYVYLVYIFSIYIQYLVLYIFSIYTYIYLMESFGVTHQYFLTH